MNFEKIYSLLKTKHYSKVLDILGGLTSSKLSRVFWGDANHAWYLAGDAYSNMEMYAEALLAFQKSLRTRTDDVQALWAIADCYSELDRPRMAERYYRRALEISEKNDLFYNLGNALFDQDKLLDAIAEYKKISKESSSYVKAQKNIKLATQLLKELE